MTLHWWMHWFWVTTQIVVSMSIPTTTEGTTLPAPTADPTQLGTSPEGLQQQQQQQGYRVAKAIGVQPTTLAADVASSTDTAPRSQHLATAASADRQRSTPSPSENRTSPDVHENKTGPASGRIPGKKDKATWVQAFSKPPRLKSSSTTTPASSSAEPSPDELTVMPLQEAVEEAKPKSLDPNAIRREQQLQQPLSAANSPGNRSADSRLSPQEAVEPQAVATAASVLEAGVGDSTRLGRARGTFTSEFHQEHRSENKEEAIKETAESSANVTEIATITGSCLAIIVLLSTVGSLGFIMYRRRYLNPPQTLNSDKCSNPDSSGYIDDSTIRDNSEEMYSLDNDSFLNSLEAMTIQNYWTDSVKHTKL